MTSLAISGKEITVQESSPSLMCMRGPYWDANLARERWGRDPSWWILPIRGSFLGPGGNLGFEFFDFDLESRRVAMNNNNKRKKQVEIAENEKISNSMIAMVS